MGIEVVSFVHRNVGIWPGRESALPAIALASHLDTVPYGGGFDGVLGNRTCLEAVQLRTEPRSRSLAVIGVADEQGNVIGSARAARDLGRAQEEPAVTTASLAVEEMRST